MLLGKVRAIGSSGRTRDIGTGKSCASTEPVAEPMQHFLGPATLSNDKDHVGSRRRG